MGYLDQDWYGLGPWTKEDPSILMRPQSQEKDPSVSLKVIKNMSKLVSRGYITDLVILAL